MSLTLDRAAIEKLSVEERYKLLELIWETLQDAAIADNPELIAEMKRRVAEAKADPEGGMSHEEFKARLAELDR